MKIYISGPITGTKDYTERFAAAEQGLAAMGSEVINPAKVNAQLPVSTTWEQYMALDYLMLDMADAIYMLDGWKKSSGACIEYGYALAKDKIVMYQQDSDFKEAVQNMIQPDPLAPAENTPPPPPPQHDNGADQPAAAGTKKPTSKRVGTGAKRKPVDAGKLFALHKAGRSVKWIADEMGIGESTVYYYLKLRGDINENNGNG